MRKNDHICQRCCYFEACTRMGRTDNLDCINRSKGREDIDLDEGETVKAAGVMQSGGQGK